MIILDNPKLVQMLKDKEIIVNEGRKISIELDFVQKDISDFEAKERKITLKVNPRAKIEAGNKLKFDINKKLKELEKLGKEIEKEKLAAIPKDIKDKHIALLKKKADLENQRNKLALKVQKIKDRLIPIVQRDVKPQLKEYEDIETAKVVDDKVEITTFSYLEDWKKNFNKK